MKRSLPLILALALAACGGGGGGALAPGSSARPATEGGSMVLSIPTSAQVTASKVRYPQFVSPNASSVTIAVNGGTASSFDVSATSSLCTTVSNARNCTIPLSAPAGSDTFTIKIYSAAAGAGTLLATANASTTVVLGTAFSLTVAMNAVIGTVVASAPAGNGTPGNCPDGLSSFNGITEGCAGSSGAVTFTVDDPSGATITGTAPFATPITITTNDPSVTASPSQITAPGQSTVFTYNGSPLGAAITNAVTVSLTVGTQVIQGPLSVRRSYLYVANSNAPEGTTPPGGGNIAVYTYGSSGTATPARVLAGASTLLSNPVEPLLDASGNLYVLDNGPYTSNSNPEILIFAPGANGNVAPTGQISGITAVDTSQACEGMTFDPTGQYLLVGCDDTKIHVFHPNPTANLGALTAQTATLTYAGFSSPLGMAFDAQGNLYVGDSFFNDIYEFTQPLPTTGGTHAISPAFTMAGGTSWPANVAPLVLSIDNFGTLYASISYVSPNAGAADANNQIAIWKTSQIPCANCIPNATLTGAPFSTHASAGFVLDPAGNMYVGNPFTNQINVFASATVAGATGTVNGLTPIRTLNTGSNPDAPTGMTIGP